MLRRSRKPLSKCHKTANRRECVCLPSRRPRLKFGVNGILAIQSLRFPRSSEAWFGIAVPAQRAFRVSFDSRSLDWIINRIYLTDLARSWYPLTDNMHGQKHQRKLPCHSRTTEHPPFVRRLHFLASHLGHLLIVIRIIMLIRSG